MIFNATMAIYRGDISDEITGKPLVKIPVSFQSKPDIVITKGNTEEAFGFDAPAFAVFSDEKGEIMRIDFEMLDNHWVPAGNS